MANMYINIREIAKRHVTNFDKMIDRSVSDRAKTFKKLVPILARFKDDKEIIEVLEAHLNKEYVG